MLSEWVKRNLGLLHCKTFRGLKGRHDEETG